MLHNYQDEDYLLSKLREGCTEAFNILYEKYWKTVYTDALRRLSNHDQSQDITQDIFAYLWLKREELQIDNLPAYLHIAVRNRVLNLFEKEKRYIPFERLLHNTLHLQSDRPDITALHNEFLNAYNALINSLPPQRRRIFKQYYEEGLSTLEIASRLSLSRKTVQNQLGRAVAFLRSELSNLFLLWLILFSPIR